MKYLKRRKLPTLSMAPMIDCVFLLLTFFVVSTTFAPIQELPVQPSPPIPRNPSIIIVIEIDNPTPGETEGRIAMRVGSGEDLIETGKMFNWFINASEDVKSIAIIQAGNEVFQEQIVWVMDMVKQTGIDKIGFVRTANTAVRIIDR